MRGRARRKSRRATAASRNCVDRTTNARYQTGVESATVQPEPMMEDHMYVDAYVPTFTPRPLSAAAALGGADSVVAGKVRR